MLLFSNCDTAESESEIRQFIFNSSRKHFRMFRRKPANRFVYLGDILCDAVVGPPRGQ